ncbi:uncharacterized protein LOC128632916 [Ictalurus punctatus]|uniref:Uncharacterized protein LOC128632916 n=1 Tax=Ictalurus punctatus TaxID=7998 RepID=A0A9F7TIT8_ICTPU|nr:uncharacterized protein LOC128632916 [Ictalurus punctatus]
MPGWRQRPLLFPFHIQVYFASLAPPKPTKKQWLGFLVHRFYGSARDWAEQLARSGSSAPYDITQFSELFLKEFSQLGQSNRLDVLKSGFEVIDKEDWPFHLCYAWLEWTEAAASLQVPVDVVESTSRCMPEGCGRETKLQCPTCKKLGLQEAFYCSNECFKNSWREQKKIHWRARTEIQPEVNQAISEPQLETYGEVSAPEFHPEVNVATSGPLSEVNLAASELQPETYGEVSPPELQPEVNLATSEIQPETRGEVSAAEEAVLLPCPAEEAILLPCPAEEAILLSCPAEEAILLSCPAEEAVPLPCPAEEAVPLSCPAEKAVPLPCPTEEAVPLSFSAEERPSELQARRGCLFAFLHH